MRGRGLDYFIIMSSFLVNNKYQTQSYIIKMATFCEKKFHFLVLSGTFIGYMETEL